MNGEAERPAWPFEPIWKNDQFAALYIEPHNPHPILSGGEPKGSPKRPWSCDSCGVEGYWDEVIAIPCTHIQIECPGCGLTPVCSGDCPGVLSDGST